MKLHLQAPLGATGVDISFRSWWDCLDGQTYWDDVSIAQRDFGSRGSMLATYQVENANIHTGGSIRSHEPDYTGSGYFDVSSDGAILQWNYVSGGGDRILATRYSWEGNVRYLELFVSGCRTVIGQRKTIRYARDGPRRRWNNLPYVVVSKAISAKILEYRACG